MCRCIRTKRQHKKDTHKWLEWVSEWLLFNVNTIFQLYHGENKLIFNEMMTLYFIYQYDFYSANSLKQQSADRHVTPLWHIIPITNQSVFAFSPYCCVVSKEATNSNSILLGSNPRSNALEASTLTIRLEQRDNTRKTQSLE